MDFISYDWGSDLAKIQHVEKIVILFEQIDGNFNFRVLKCI